MKQSASSQKTTQPPDRSFRADTAAGPNGIAIAPPAYGIEVVDRKGSLERPDSPAPPLIQPKLIVTPPGDPYEQEADRVAAQVVQQLQAPTPAQSPPGAAVQRQATVNRPGPVQSLLQRRGAMAGGEAAPEVTSTINRARGGGQPLETGLQQRMGEAMGADFSRVRMHTDTRADQLNQTLQAQAFTTGQDVFFRAGAYQPKSQGGQTLIAHELAHVMQQKGGDVQRTKVRRDSSEESATTNSIDRTVWSPKIIQRHVGVEFELPSISTWQAKWPWGLDSALTNSNRQKRLKKGEPLLRGEGFEMQADDYPEDSGVSDMEFVTDAFPTTGDGQRNLETALEGIEGICDNIINKNSPMAVNELSKSDDNIHTAKRTGFIKYSVRDSEKFPSSLEGKPQITVGLKLGRLSTFMADIFKSGAPEEPHVTRRLQLGRKELTGLSASDPGRMTQIVGDASRHASQAIAKMHNDQSVSHKFAQTPRQPPETPEFKSFLAMIIVYLSMGNAYLEGSDQLPLVSSYPKTIAPLMARTDFAAMFNLLRLDEREFYKNNKGENLKGLVRKVPDLNDLNEPVFAKGIKISNPQGGFRSNDDFRGLPRSQWLEGMVANIDYLTKYHFPTRNQRKNIEGLGGYKDKTDQVGNANAPIFELRTIPSRLQYKDLKPLVMKTFRYVQALNREHDLKYGEEIWPSSKFWKA